MKEYVWNLDKGYPGFESESFEKDFKELKKVLSQLEVDPKIEPIKRYESLG